MKLSELLEQIDTKTAMNPDWDNPNYLADLLLVLASYYATLGRFVAEAERAARFGEVHYKFVQEQEKLGQVEKGDSATLAESKGRVASRADQDEWVQLKYKATLLSLSRQNLEKTMDAIRSKLAYLKFEKESQ
jgi:hypothetical protein